ncbi:hypothetical protein K1719_018360 [Acacia pycnantha]|nr:hypothetical protein K1719_018360 [Acacia pycnantha]
MERSLIIKLLGRSITYRDLASRTQFLWQPRGSYQLVDMEGSFYCVTFDLEEDYMKVLTGDPWMIYGAYLTVQPWTLNFDSKSDVVSKVIAWIRIPGCLSIRYYHKSTLKAIGTLLGDVVKIDYMTETRGRAKYAHIVVLIDLLSPLVPQIKELNTSDQATGDSDGASSSPFGVWMQSGVGSKGGVDLCRKMEQTSRMNGNGAMGNQVVILENQPLRSGSSLDNSKHIVMILQKSRQALEDLTSVSKVRNQAPISPMLSMGDAGGGKENRAQGAFQKCLTMHGVKLQPSGIRNLRVRKKAPGV